MLLSINRSIHYFISKLVCLFQFFFVCVLCEILQVSDGSYQCWHVIWMRRGLRYNITHIMPTVQNQAQSEYRALANISHSHYCHIARWRQACWLVGWLEFNVPFSAQIRLYQRRRQARNYSSHYIATAMQLVLQLQISPIAYNQGGIPCHSHKLYPGPCNSVDMQPWTDRQIHKRTSPQYILRRLQLMRNVMNVVISEPLRGCQWRSEPLRLASDCDYKQIKI